MQGDYLLRAVLTGAVLCRAVLAAMVRPNRGVIYPGWAGCSPLPRGVMESEDCLLLCLQKLSERNCALWKMKLPLAGECDLE